MRVLKFKRRINIDKTIGNAHIKTFRFGSHKNDKLKQWTELYCWYECDCEECPLSWEDRGPEDVDCGCYMAEYGDEYPKSLLVCMLPRWVKKILLRRVKKRQEKEDLEYLEYLNKCEAERIEAERIVAESEINHAHWIDNHNGTISCSYCHTWFNKDDRYSYMRYCPYCKMKLTESEGKE